MCKLLNTIKYLIIIIAVTLIAVSCSKKKPDAVKALNIEYRVTATSGFNYFTSIKYNNASGAAVEGFTTGMTSFSQIISVTNKPFTARITTAVNNIGKTPVNYELTILVDGSVKSNITQTAPAQLQSTGALDFTVN